MELLIDPESTSDALMINLPASKARENPLGAPTQGELVGARLPAGQLGP